MTISTCLRTAKLSVASIRPMQLRLARLGCGRSHSGTTRIERQRTAMLQPERLRWQHSPRAGGGNSPALPLPRPLASFLGAEGPPGPAVTRQVTQGTALAKSTLPNRLILLARSEGFEPPTPRFEVWCSIQLSYERRSPF